MAGVTLKKASNLKISTALALLFAIGLTNANAADVTVVSGQTETSTVNLTDGDTLTVDSGGTVSTTATDGVLGPGTGDISVINNGTISSGGAWPNAAIQTAGDLTNLDNNGTITGNAAAVRVQGTFGTIDNSGTIQSLNDIVFSLNSGTTFTNSGTITAKKGVIEATGGITTFTNTGTIETTDTSTSTFGTLLDVDSIGTFNNSGTINSQDFGISVDTTIGSFTNSGSITADSKTLHAGGLISSVNNTVSGTINTANGYGISSNTGIGSVTNAGSITSRLNTIGNGASGAEVGSVTNSGTLTSSQGHVVLSNGDMTLLNNTGTMTGAQNGVEVNGNLTTFTNSNLLSGGWAGLTVSGNIGSVDNSGTINAGSNEGIKSGGTITTFTNSGTIKSTNGIGVNANYFGSFVNSNMIDAGSTGIYSQTGFGSFNNSGTIKSASNGVVAGGTNGAVVNTGTITATGSGFQGGETASFNNSGTITGGDGVSIGGFSSNQTSFVNSGTITGNTSNGVSISQAISSFNNSGTINAGGVGVSTSMAVNSFINSSTINATGNGVEFQGVVTSFHNSGSITSQNATGFYSNTDVGTLTNTSTISGGSFSYGIYVDGNVTGINNSGTVSGRNGLYLNSGSTTDQVSITNMGSITGTGFDGAYINQAISTFNNSGTITGSFRGIRAGRTVGSFINSNTISATNDGVEFAQDVTSFNNSGSITSTSGKGVDAQADITTFTNSGTITGGSTDQGVYMYGGASTIDNSGTISGQSGIHLRRSTSSGDVTINNSGTITATGTGSHYAIYLGFSGSDTINLNEGSILNGGINWDGTGDTLNINQGGNVSIDVTNNPDNVSFSTGVGTNAGGVVTQVNPAANSIASDLGVGITQSFAGNVGNRFSSVGAPSGDSLANGNGYSFAPSEAASRAAWASFWATGSDQDGVLQTTSVAAGFMGGIDWTEQNGELIGIYAGYGAGEIKTPGTSGQEVDTSTVAIGVYGRKNHSDMLLDYKLTAGVIGFDSKRMISGGTVTATADYNGLFIAPEITLTKDHGQARTMFTVGYSVLFIDSYTEVGGGATTFGARNSHYVSARAEYELDKDFSDANGDNVLFRPYMGIEGGLGFGDFNSGSIIIAGTSVNYDTASDDESFRGFAGLRFGKNLNDTTKLFGSTEVGYDNNKTFSGKVQFGISKKF